MISGKKSYLLLLWILFNACTVTRWSIIDEQVINPGYSPDILVNEEVIVLEQYPTPEYPVAVFNLMEYSERQFQLLEMKERNIQQFRPRWFLTTAGLMVAAGAALAANTSVLPVSLNSDQKVLLNIAAPVAALIPFVKQKPVEEPIFTGETELGKPVGFQIVADTVRASDLNSDRQADINLLYQGEIIGSRSGAILADGQIDLNLALLTQDLSRDFRSGDEIDAEIYLNGKVFDFTIPVSSFLSPYVIVTEPVVQLRSSPLISDLNVLTEVGQGSRFFLIDDGIDEWYNVRFGGSEVFLPKMSSETEWRSVFMAGAPDVFEFRAVPFGQIDVERSVPVLKDHNPADRALVLTNAFSGDSEPRQYLDRDHDLFLFYMRSAFQLNNEQISVIDMDKSRNWVQRLREMSPTDSTGSLYIYLSGDATIKQDNSIGVLHMQESPEESIIKDIIFTGIERIGAGQVFLFADLQFIERAESERSSELSRSMSIQVLEDTAAALINRMPESVILFSNRPGQKSSLFAGSGVENKRHHIFNYFLAEALQQRRLRMSDIISHMENNVDYMSRRLHDRSQEIQAFGNRNLLITGK